MAQGTGEKRINMKKGLLYICVGFLYLSCTAQNKISSTSLKWFLNDTSLQNAHVGVSIYDVASRRYLVAQNDTKYFVPASNVKIVTTYAAMKYLKHFLSGIRYYETDTAVYLLPTGDPTLLHRDFPVQPVIDFLKQQKKSIYISEQNWLDQELGKGWSWDDFSDEYMTERNALPVYGNTLKWVQEKFRSNERSTEESFSVYSDPEVSWKVKFEPDPLNKKFGVKRDRFSNTFTISEGTEEKKELYVPFITNGISTSLEFLADTVRNPIRVTTTFLVTDPQRKTINSQPVDSVLRPMMYRSDNFFAEQLLLMVAEERFGVLDAESLIDTLLSTDLAILPQQPEWVDGSGLSRYNLFTPRDFVVLLDTMRVQFGMDRLKAIFPSGDSGTMKGYYNREARRVPYIFAKTGSMSGVVALSGYLYTRKNRLLVFSILVNNFTGKTAPLRRAIERFLEEVRND